MIIFGWTMISFIMAMFAFAMMIIDMPEEDFDRITKILIKRIRLRWYFGKLIRELKRA